MTSETKPKGEIIIYKDKEGPELAISFQDETLWLSLQQLADLFGRDKSVISRHIKNIFSDGELKEKSVVANYATTAADGKTYQVDHYNLDMAISVGYRVNSRRGTQFRIWATQKLREYLMTGYIINEKRLREAQDNRLKELQQAHLFIRQAVEAKRLAGYEKELASIINDYTQTWITLNRYDEGDFKVAAKNRKTVKNLDYSRAKMAVEHFKARLVQADQASGTFGQERGTQLADLLRAVSRQKLGLEEKSAQIFYEIIKKKPFIDGNKRIASLLFVVFLIENHFLYDTKGERKFNDNGLITLALLIEETSPSDKSTILKLIASLVGKK